LLIVLNETGKWSIGMDTKRKMLLTLWLVVIGSIVLCLQPFDFVLNLVGFVMATVGGFSLIFLRRKIGRINFIVLELLFIAAIAVAFFVNMGTV
jgi:hypothetical protein